MTDDEGSGGAAQQPRRLPLRNRRGEEVEYALLDAEDYERLGSRSYSHKKDEKGPGYAYRGESRGGKQRRIYLAREVMRLGLGDPREVDHISRDTLDNRKFNLRICSHAENRQNTKGWDGASSKYRGVSWDKTRGKWKAQAKAGGKNQLIGRFATETAARDAVVAWRRDHMSHSID